MTKLRVGLIGGSSFVGERLLLLLNESGYETVVFSRKEGDGTISLYEAVKNPVGLIESWFCLAPVWTLVEHFRLLETHGAKKLVALSSTSRFSKIHSSSVSDRQLVSSLVEGENKGLEWAHQNKCIMIILHPTLIYGLGKDKNVTEISRVIRKFKVFPLLGKGDGLRQPVHVDDVATACLSALQNSIIKSRSYVLSGRETLTYRDMVVRVFEGLGCRPRFIRCPLWLFVLAVRLAKYVPQFRGVTIDIAIRMNKDHNFEHSAAKRELGFTPRSFHPTQSDLIAVSRKQ